MQTRNVAGAALSVVCLARIGVVVGEALLLHAIM